MSGQPFDAWTTPERAVLDALRTPGDIQTYLDECPYSTDPIYRSPRSVMRDRRAHCVDGALFAAAALRRLGHPPLIMELRAERDDDHLLAIFRRRGLIGAVAKSNFVGLRFREPIHRTFRELALSYFHSYFNLEHVWSVRSYSVTLDLARYDHLGWEHRDSDLERVVDALDRVRHVPLIDAAAVSELRPVDARTFAGHSHGVDWDGVYDPAAHAEAPPK